MKLGLLIMALVLAALPAVATDLRGRVDGLHDYSQQPFPLAGVYVTIFRIDPTPYGLQYRPIATTMTGNDGMYYFKGMWPGNNYVMQVAGSNYPLAIMPVPGQDIQAVLVRF